MLLELMLVGLNYGTACWIFTRRGKLCCMLLSTHEIATCRFRGLGIMIAIIERLEMAKN